MSRKPDRGAAVRHLLPINRLPPANQDALVAESELQTFLAGQVIYPQGNEDDYVHYLLDGTVELLSNGKVVRQLPATSKAARRALAKPGRKRHSVRAVSNCSILRIPRRDFDTQLKAGHIVDVERQVEVSETATETASNWMIKMLRSDLFKRLPAINIQKIFGRMERIPVAADDVVMRHGRPSDYYYVIERGYCEISRQTQDGREVYLADLGAGDAFGEAAIIGGAACSVTVTMLSGGTLLRLRREDFNELIRKPVLHAVSPKIAIPQIDAGAEWLDVRRPEEHTKPLLQSSRNMPFNVLRARASQLDKTKKYVVCCEDVQESAVGAFLLIERGINADYLDDTISQLAAEHPRVLAAERTTEEPTINKVVVFPGAALGSDAQPTPKKIEERNMEDHLSDGDSLESAIDNIDRLYSLKEWEAEKAARVPIEDYAQTLTGQRLADLIDEMDEKSEPLPTAKAPEGRPAVDASEFSIEEVLDIMPDESEASESKGPTVLLVDSDKPKQSLGEDSLHDELLAGDDGLAQIIKDFEHRIRDYAETVALRRTSELEGRYEEELNRVRAAAAVEVRKRQELSRQRYEQQYKKSELKLREHYKKVMALANKISQQKAQLQLAKKQFEEKILAANAVYKQVEGMRKSLRKRMGESPSDPASDKRQSA